MTYAETGTPKAALLSVHVPFAETYPVWVCVSREEPLPALVEIEAGSSYFFLLLLLVMLYLLSPRCTDLASHRQCATSHSNDLLSVHLAWRPLRRRRFHIAASCYRAAMCLASSCDRGLVPCASTFRKPALGGRPFRLQHNCHSRDARQRRAFVFGEFPRRFPITSRETKVHDVIQSNPAQQVCDLYTQNVSKVYFLYYLPPSLPPS